MYLIFSPHNPLLISKLSREHADKFSKSINAWKYLKRKIYNINPQKILIIMPSYERFENISINQSEDYAVNFKEFGDLSIEFKIAGDLDLSNRLKYFLRKNDLEVNLFSDQYVNYKSFLPFYYLNKYHLSSAGFDHEMEHLGDIPNEFVVLNCANNDLNYHLKFGKLLADFLKEEDDEEMVVIFCGDLFKNIKDNQKNISKEKTKKIIDIINKNNYDDFLELESELSDFDCPFLRPLVSIIPIIKNYNLQSNIISLDNVFNEIYLTAEFE